MSKKAEKRAACVRVPISFLLCDRPTHASAHVAEYAGTRVEAGASVVRRSACGARWLPLVVT